MITTDPAAVLKTWCTCGHTEFIHSDRDERPCIYSGCECLGFVRAATPTPVIRSERYEWWPRSRPGAITPQEVIVDV